MTDDKLTLLLEYVRADGRVCPNPQEWNALWEMLPDKKHLASGWNPPLPLILSAWWHTPALPKIIRFEEHIRYAAEHEFLDQVDEYLRSLKPDQWFKIGK